LYASNLLIYNLFIAGRTKSLSPSGVPIYRKTIADCICSANNVHHSSDWRLWNQIDAW